MKFTAKFLRKSSDLKSLVEQFRREQENWFEWEEDKMCFREQCYTIAPLLAKFLTQHGFVAKPYHGYFITEDGEEHNHWWVMVGRTIVDITADQFYPGEENDWRVVITEAPNEHYSIK